MLKTLLAAVVAGAFLISVPVAHAEDKAPAADKAEKAPKEKKEKKDKKDKKDEAKKEEKAGGSW
ncbi:MAG: hypothetical protein ABI560_04900 [Myxococcales bacterium]